jgi:peptidyl-prolyl cis-trans isomerase SurA
MKRWIPVVAAAGLALAACGPTLSGSAAVVGEQRLTDSELAQTTSQLTDQLGIPESAQVSQAVLSRWIVAELVDEMAARRGVTVTKGDVDAAVSSEAERAGGQEALEQAALQAGVLPDTIPDVVRTTLLVEGLSRGTITGDDPTGQTGLLTQIQALSEEVSPQVSPRFGTWDPAQLSVGALPDDLSSPAGATEALVGLPPQQ